MSVPMHYGNKNALKHGAFSADIILPGEDVEGFNRIFDSLVAEWSPDGPIELDAVMTLAKCLWRKRRIAISRRDKSAKWNMVSQLVEIDGRRAIEDAVIRLAEFADLISEKKDEFDVHEDQLTDYLPAACVKYLTLILPERDFSDHRTWASAVAHEIDYIMSPTLDSLMNDDKKLAIFLPMHQELTFRESDMANEVALDERIDTMIDRTIKRLMQTKALKEILETKKVTGHSQEGPLQIEMTTKRR